MQNVTTANVSLEEYILQLRIALYKPVLNQKDLVDKAKQILDNTVFEITEDNYSYRLLAGTV